MASRETNLAKNTIILSIGKFLPKVVSTITLPIVTACLTKAEYGTYDLIATLISLLMPVATLQIQSAAFRFLIECRGDKEGSSSIITNILCVVIPISFIVSFALFLLYPGLSSTARAIIAFYFFIDSLETTMGQVTRGLGGNFDYALSSIILSFINGIGIVVSLLLMNSGIVGIISSLCIANIIALVYLLLRKNIFSYIKLSKISMSKIKEMISYSWPMVPNNLSNWVLKLSDRLIITGFLGVEANAVYAVANKIPNLLSSAQSVFVSAWQENAALAVKDDDASQYFSKMFNEIFSLMIGCVALLIAFTPVMFALLIKGDYGEAYNEMPILILGMFFYCMSAFQGGIYIAHKRTRSVGITTMVAAGVNVVIDLSLINILGITAGSISTLVAYLVLYVYRTVDSLRFQPMDYHIKKQIGCYILVVFMLFICFLQNFYLNIFNIIFGTIVCIILNRQFIYIGIDKLKEMRSK